MPTSEVDQRLVGERRGTGSPVVLLHGIGHSRHAWDPIVELLAQHREVVTVDLPGHGDSPLPRGDGPLGVEELTDLIEQFLVDAGIDGPLVVGNSLGGAIALELARRGAASSVVALAPIGFWSRLEVGYVVVVLRVSRLLARRLPSRLLASAPVRLAALGIYFAHPLRLDPAQALRTVRGFAHATGVDAILPYSRRYRFRRGHDLREVPVTIAWGDRDRLLIGGQARRATALLPTARHVRVASSGHVPMPDAPHRIAALILNS
jgi:pimeloyl-ACP methyl ester carboxylesterase